ncbi:MAG: response regulator [Blautia sp.]|nr:response regulator [Blautia sp.]MDY4000831.1 response regulator [Blautia sp.]
MKTAETINVVCAELGITKADLAKQMGIHPSSLYRKLARESMTLEELQNCLDVLGVTIEFNLQYPDGKVRSSQANHEMLLERMDLLEKELEAARKAAEFHKKSLRDLRTELSSAVGYTELGMRHGYKAEEYLEKIRLVLTNVELTIAYALGEPLNDEPDSEEPENIEALAGKRVLLVDDNELNCEIMKEVLVDHGLLVENAGNGSEAVAAVKANEPGYYQFILMDIEMPVMDGFEATMKIRKLPNRIRANIPIIALTANPVPENRERAVAVGMDDFLVKPTNSARLLRTLAKFQ